MVIKTNPETTEYDLISGCVKYNVDYDNGDIQTIKIQNPEEVTTYKIIIKLYSHFI